MVPGLVRVRVVSAKSGTVSLFALTLPMSSSYARTKPAKSRVSACLMLGTSRVRDPSGRRVSTARPRLTWAGRAALGLPSTSRYMVVITGTASRALTTA